jgi:Flp pilus assembly protein TadG
MPLSWRRTGASPGRGGAAAVEFALVAPVLVLVVMGMIELGRSIMVLDLLNHAARVGILPANGNTEITNAVDSSLASSGIQGADAPVIDVKPEGSDTWISPGNAGTATTGAAIRVRVSVKYNKVTWLASTWFVGSNTNLSSNVVMSKE